MDRKKILETIEQLSLSQGFYGRLLRDIESLEEEKFEELMEFLEEQKFSDAVDLVLFFEQ